MIKDLDLKENSTIGATTRSSSKAERQEYIHKEGQLVEKKIHQLIRRHTSDNGGVHMGSLYTTYIPRIN